MSSARRLLIAALGVGAFVLGAPSTASANGDPASDVLLTRNVFVPGEFTRTPPGGNLPPARVDQLRTLVGNANTRGYRLKLALIAAPSDLGLVYQLWRQPQPYARFLGQELFVFANYRGRLLIVMANGYGFYNNGKSVKRERRVLQALALPKGAVDIARAAEVAVLRLAAADGVRLALPPLPASREPSTSKDERNLVWITAVVFSLIAIAAMAYAWLRVRRRRGPSETDAEAS